MLKYSLIIEICRFLRKITSFYQKITLSNDYVKG